MGFGPEGHRLDVFSMHYNCIFKLEVRWRTAARVKWNAIIIRVFADICERCLESGFNNICGHHAVLSASHTQWSSFPAVNHYVMLQELIIHSEQKYTAGWIRSCLKMIGSRFAVSGEFPEWFYFFVHVAWSKFVSISFCMPPSPEFASIHETSFFTFSLTRRLYRSFFDFI